MGSAIFNRQQWDNYHIMWIFPHHVMQIQKYPRDPNPESYFQFNRVQSQSINNINDEDLHMIKPLTGITFWKRVHHCTWGKQNPIIASAPYLFPMTTIWLRIVEIKYHMYIYNIPNIQMQKLATSQLIFKIKTKTTNNFYAFTKL